MFITPEMVLIMAWILGIVNMIVFKRILTICEDDAELYSEMIDQIRINKIGIALLVLVSMFFVYIDLIAK